MEDISVTVEEPSTITAEIQEEGEIIAEVALAERVAPEEEVFPDLLVIFEIAKI